MKKKSKKRRKARFKVIPEHTGTVLLQMPDGSIKEIKGVKIPKQGVIYL